MSEGELYAGREQTQVKHFVLQKYLERFAHIIGFRWRAITYVDCFSGPWNVGSDELEDSSFAIAYDDAWTLTLSNPLVWESDLKEWIADWRKQQSLTIEGLRPGQRVPQREQHHALIWHLPTSTR
jgi:hypothetical protein